MPYVPPELKERIKREVSIQRLAEARGIKLRRSGKELIGLCPFHKDTNPSLNIDRSKTFGLQGRVRRRRRRHQVGDAGRGHQLHARDGTAEAELSSFRHQHSRAAAKNLDRAKLPPLFQTTIDDQKLLGVVVDYYHATLKRTPGAQQYLLKRGLQSAEMVEHFRLGFSNRSLNYRLQDKNRVEGLRQRGRLEEWASSRRRPGMSTSWDGW